MGMRLKRLLICICIFSFVFFSIDVNAAQTQTKPSTPIITQDIKVQTESDVKITISNWGNAIIKEYKIENGPWQTYSLPVIIKENSIIYARAKNASGIASDIASLEVKNIRKLLSKTEVSKKSISTVKILYYDINDVELGNGSGFIVSSDGLIVTNYHVIDMVPKIKVVTSDNVTYEVLGVTAYDIDSDLAVIKLANAKNLPAVKLGDSDGLELGQDVVAIGYPLGLNVTVSFGTISSLNAPGGLLRTKKNDIQITAPISSGNSGGPLLNMYGEVIGVNYSTIVNAQNINYSIPINEVKSMLTSSYIKPLNQIINEAHPTMNYSEYSSYLYFNYPDKKVDEYTFSFSDIFIHEPPKTPGEVDVFIDLNALKYGEILLAELEGNKQKVEQWADDIYKCVKAKYQDKNVYIVISFSWSFNTCLDGYSEDEISYNSKTNMWEIYRIKLIYGYEKNNMPAASWN